ncbi:MAG: hypothetical protein J6Y29_02935 [Clostridiales bacterium]|nr:hypothetical protein [Clostridiales bacterium]
MATIKSAIQLTDGMSPVLKNMTNALNTVINSFESMQKVSSNAINVNSLQGAREELSKVENEFTRIEENIKDASNKQKQFNEDMRNGGSAADSLGSKIKSIASGLLGFAAVRKGISFISGSMDLNNIQTNAENQLKVTLKNMGAVSGAYDEIKKKASEIQQNGIYGDESLIAGAAEFATYMKDTDAIKKMMDTLANYSIGMSGGGELDTQAIVNYATNLGKITNGAFDAMTKKGFTFTDAQKAVINGTAKESEYVEVLGEKYKDMTQDMRAATVISEVIGESWSGLYDKMSNTPQGAIISFKNAWGDVREEVGKVASIGIMDFFNSIRDSLPTIKEMCMSFATAVSWIASRLGDVISIAADVVEFFKSHWSIIEPIVLGVATAFILYKGAMLAAAAITAIQTAATFALTVAQHGLNAAMAASPLTWVLMIIVAIVAAVVAVCQAIANATGVAKSFFGVITGGINVALTAMKNLFFTYCNIVLGIWNGFWACCDNIGIAFHNAIQGVKSLFYSLLSTALNVVAGICKALNKLPFIEFDYSGITNKAEDYARKADEAQKGKKEYVDIKEAFDKGMSTFETFKDGWAKEAWDSGSKWGDGVVDSVKSMFEVKGLDTNDDLKNNTGQIAEDTAAMKNSMDALEDSLEYMVDIAEREAINRYTTAEIKVDMTNNNSINNSMDIDGVVDALSTKVYEAMLVSAEGVHY